MKEEALSFIKNTFDFLYERENKRLPDAFILQNYRCIADKYGIAIRPELVTYLERLKIQMRSTKIFSLELLPESISSNVISIKDFTSKKKD